MKKILIGLCYFCVIKISNLLILRDYRYNCLYFIGIFEVYVKVVLINFIFIVICELFLNWVRSKFFIFNYYSLIEENIYSIMINNGK